MKVKNMDSKMTTNSKQSTTKSKTTKTNEAKQLEQEQKPQKWRSHGGLSTGELEGERRGKGTKNK